MRKLMILGLLLTAGLVPEISEAYKFVDIGDPYPPFCTSDMNGDQICSDQYQNAILLLSFVRIDQPDSLDLLRTLQEMHVKYGSRNIVVVGVLSGETEPQALQDLIEQQQLTISILLDPQRQIYGAFGVFLYPATGVFDQGGLLRFYLPGKPINSARHLEGYLTFLLGDISDDELAAVIRAQKDEASPETKQAENYYNFANMYVKRGEFAKARVLLESSIGKYADYAPFYALYGTIYLREDACQQALEQFELALQHNSQLEEAIAGKALCLERLSEHHN